MIYTVTSIALDDEHIQSLRCFGYFNELSRALIAVEDNECDIEESYYDFVVIEGFEEGIHPIAKTELWFEWDKHLQKFMPCVKNKIFFGNRINFGIG